MQSTTVAARAHSRKHEKNDRIGDDYDATHMQQASQKTINMRLDIRGVTLAVAGTELRGLEAAAGERELAPVLEPGSGPRARLQHVEHMRSTLVT